MDVPLTPLATCALGSTRGSTVSRGEANGAAKLSDDDVRAIRASVKTHRALAAEYGVSRSLISEIRARRWWTHVI